jgi:hypothetical protein
MLRGVDMYLRFTRRSNADGSVVRYVSIAHNQRVDGKVTPNVLVNLAGSTRTPSAGSAGWPRRSTDTSALASTRTGSTR